MNAVQDCTCKQCGARWTDGARLVAGDRVRYAQAHLTAPEMAGAPPRIAEYLASRRGTVVRPDPRHADCAIVDWDDYPARPMGCSWRNLTRVMLCPHCGADAVETGPERAADALPDDAAIPPL